MITVTPFIPQNITVHLGGPDTPAANVTVPFIDYVKNVASSEIYPTWDESALVANILAIISFALNRVYTEYYRSRGYNFDITSSTAIDQKFINGRNYFGTVERVVDNIFDNYLRRPGFIEPLAAKFCNGTTATCEGLSQWGSQALAQQGLNSIQILRRYYGNNLEVVTDAPIRGYTPSYPGTPLRTGSRGPNVVRIQVILNRISRNYPAIPKINPVDGVFGTQTENAVRAFQRIFGLTADGIVGKATWYQLIRVYVAVNRFAELESLGQTFYSVAWQFTETLREGSSGEAVRRLQYMLDVLSEFISSIPSVGVDGVFGAQTRNAVVAFQRFAGLNPDGVVGAQTWDALYDQYAGVESNTGFRSQRFIPPTQTFRQDSAQEAASINSPPPPIRQLEELDERLPRYLTQFSGATLRVGSDDF